MQSLNKTWPKPRKICAMIICITLCCMISITHATMYRLAPVNSKILVIAALSDTAEIQYGFSFKKVRYNNSFLNKQISKYIATSLNDHDYKAVSLYGHQNESIENDHIVQNLLLQTASIVIPLSERRSLKRESMLLLKKINKQYKADYIFFISGKSNLFCPLIGGYSDPFNIKINSILIETKNYKIINAKSADLEQSDSYDKNYNRQICKAPSLYSQTKMINALEKELLKTQDLQAFSNKLTRDIMIFETFEGLKYH